MTQLNATRSKVLTGERLELILDQHGINPKFWPAMKALVFENRRPGKELLTRLHHVANYKAAFDTILAELSKPVTHKFPPKIKHYESVEVPV